MKISGAAILYAVVLESFAVCMRHDTLALTATDIWVLLPESDYVTLGSLLSQIRLSSVCLSVTLAHPI